MSTNGTSLVEARRANPPCTSRGQGGHTQQLERVGISVRPDLYKKTDPAAKRPGASAPGSGPPNPMAPEAQQKRPSKSKPATSKQGTDATPKQPLPHFSQAERAHAGHQFGFSLPQGSTAATPGAPAPFAGAMTEPLHTNKGKEREVAPRRASLARSSGRMRAPQGVAFSDQSADEQVAAESQAPIDDEYEYDIPGSEDEQLRYPITGPSDYEDNLEGLESDSEYRDQIIEDIEDGEDGNDGKVLDDGYESPVLVPRHRRHRLRKQAPKFDFDYADLLDDAEGIQIQSDSAENPSKSIDEISPDTQERNDAQGLQSAADKRSKRKWAESQPQAVQSKRHLSAPESANSSGADVNQQHHKRNGGPRVPNMAKLQQSAAHHAQLSGTGTDEEGSNQSDATRRSGHLRQPPVALNLAPPVLVQGLIPKQKDPSEDLKFYPSQWQDALEDAKDNCRQYAVISNGFPSSKIPQDVLDIQEQLDEAVVDYRASNRLALPEGFYPECIPGMTILLFADIRSWRGRVFKDTAMEVAKSQYAFETTCLDDIGHSSTQKAEMISENVNNLLKKGKFLAAPVDKADKARQNWQNTELRPSGHSDAMSQGVLWAPAKGQLSGSTAIRWALDSWKSGVHDTKHYFDGNNYCPAYKALRSLLRKVEANTIHGPLLKVQRERWAREAITLYRLYATDPDEGVDTMGMEVILD
ncbi:hypothetical protein CCMSSC00406_0004699 [Pleurotus cornucopiae]|uniref:Uncharacterized protein n=1 Tax=Pleurotus cornucopiae TaxID=5321 RepID=A0ACB7J1Q4_PLECO|nr:hypothetical protein CCMSSC00406_0004699 [Pleurotus cornucopiae]